MTAPSSEHHPACYAWRERFPDAARVVSREGGAVYAAESGRDLWLISDESVAASFLADDNDVDAVTISHYRDRELWVADIVRVRRGGADDAVTDTWPGPFDAALRQLVNASAAERQRLAADRGLATVNERDHLQPVCAEVARRLADAWDDKPTVSTQSRVAFDSWPRVGNVDIAITGSDQTSALLELKCGAGRDSLGQCVWDAVKLALAVLRNKGIGFLLAGAPRTDWERPVRGAEFFADGGHDSALLRVLYADWWRHYERLNDPQPSELPRAFWTEHVHTAPFAVADHRWELRLAQVFAQGDVISWPTLAPGGAAS